MRPSVVKQMSDVPDAVTGIAPKAAEGPAQLAGFVPDVLTGIPP